LNEKQQRDGRKPRTQLDNELPPLTFDRRLTMSQDKVHSAQRSSCSATALCKASSAEDRRRRHVVLTDLGKAKFAEAKELWQTAQDRFNTIFGKPGAESLRSTLLSIAHDDRLAALRD
jgi:hypothetical protein